MRPPESLADEAHRQARGGGAVRTLRALAERDAVIAAVEAATGLAWKDLRSAPGWRRQVLTEALVRFAGMRNVEVTRRLGLAESKASQDRGRLARCDDSRGEIASVFRRLESLVGNRE